MSDHRFPELEVLQNNQDVVSVVYGTGSYYYAGYQNKPDTDAFGNTMRWFRNDEFSNILCFTHPNNSMPDLRVDIHHLKADILAWKMFGSPKGRDSKGMI